MGGGTVYVLSPFKGGTWTETIAHNFAGGSDGCNPLSGVTLDETGNVYGTTYACGMQGGITYGIVFKLSPSSGMWNETVLHAFTGGSDGGWPFGGVILDSSGNLYGSAYTGGNRSCAYSKGCGVIFRLSSHGKNWHESVIYNFSSLANANPSGPLIFDSAGNLYGTASDGAPGNSCCGTVFELSPKQNGTWKETTLHSFQRALDGAYPDGGLLLDAAGDLYGTAPYGGPANEGVVFEIIP